MGLIKPPMWGPEASALKEMTPFSDSRANRTSPGHHRLHTRSPLRARTAALLQRLRAEPAPAHGKRAPAAPAAPPPAHVIGEADLNRVHLSGTLGSEPLLYDVGDHLCATLALASQRRWRTASGAEQLETTWFNLSAWEDVAEQCGRLLHRGDRVYVEGSLLLWTALRAAQSYACHTVVLERIVLLAAGGFAAEGTKGSE